MVPLRSGGQGAHKDGPPPTPGREGERILSRQAQRVNPALGFRYVGAVGGATEKPQRGFRTRFKNHHQGGGGKAGFADLNVNAPPRGACLQMSRYRRGGFSFLPYNLAFSFALRQALAHKC